MKNVGVICEYNPLHGGHKYMLSVLRELGAERIICLMSGNAVQRGDLAVMPKHRRARAACLAGADAVLELPFPHSMGSAEHFARAGVDILARAGVDTIAFGSETGSIELLRELAADSEGYSPSKDKSIGTASDYFAPLGNIRSNDILALEYLKAGKKTAEHIDFVAIRRAGAGYHDDAEDGAFPSATELRRALREDKLKAYSDSQLPNVSRYELAEAMANGETAYMKNIESAILSFWRLCDADKVSLCAECGGGVAQRLMRAARSAVSLEDMARLAATKRYTDSRLRRAMIFGMTGVKSSDLKDRVRYVELLAANGKGLEFLDGVKDIAVLAKPSRIPGEDVARRQLELRERFEALYTLAMSTPRESGMFLKQSPVILKG